MKPNGELAGIHLEIRKEEVNDQGFPTFVNLTDQCNMSETREVCSRGCLRALDTLPDELVSLLQSQFLLYLLRN